MRARRKILSSVLATSLVVSLLQVVAFAAPVTIGGSFKIETKNMMQDPNNSDAQIPVPAENIYTVDPNAGTVTVQPGAIMTLSGDASDYRIIVLGGEETVDITLDGFTSERTTVETESGGSGGTTGGDEGGSGNEGDGQGSGETGGDQGGTESGGSTTGGDTAGGTGEGESTEGNGDTSGIDTNAAVRANESAGSAIALQNGANVTIHLKGTNTVKGGAGAAAIEVPAGATLVIDEVSGGKGTLNATAAKSGTSGTGAAIGGSAGQNSGNITINSGTVKASVVEDARGNGAAIGGGAGGSNGTITIGGGEVTANAAGNGAAIGGGMGGGAGTITISGGKVTANAVGNTSGNGAAIGGGGRSTTGGIGAGGTIVISGGEVTAKGNIGGGEGAIAQGTLAVSGSTTKVSVSELIGASVTIADGASVDVELDEDLTVPTGQTMTIPAGMTLTIPSGKTLTVKGTLEINGKIDGSGKLDCFRAEEVTGAENIGGGVDYKKPCPHEWPNEYRPYDRTRHVKYCTKCEKEQYGEHKFSNGICLECKQWEDPKYIFVKEDKTLTVYQDFGGPDINTEDWENIAKQAEEIVIVEGVQYIAENAFNNFENAKHIYIPESTEEINGSTFPDEVDGKLTVYCPNKWIEAIDPTEDTVAKFVFYEMSGDLAVITKITDKNVEIPKDIYGKAIYFADGSLKDFTDVEHQNRIPAGGVETADTRRHYYKCAICGKDVKERHEGGKATCVDKAVCVVCGDEYERLDRNSHSNLKMFTRQEATHLEDGNILYWYCSDCDRYFSDSAAEDRIKEKSTILKATKEHTPQQTEWLTDAVEHWHTCECGELIDVKPHSFEWVVDRVATETENGLRHERCSVCGFEKAPEEIPRLNQSNNANQPGDGDSNNGNQNNGNQNNGNQNDGNQNNGNQNNGNQNNGNQNNGNQNGGTNTGTGSGTNTGTGTGTSTGTTAGSGNNTNTDKKTGIAGVVKTGDYATLLPWIALLIASGAGIVGVVVYKKVKSKKSEK